MRLIKDILIEKMFMSLKQQMNKFIRKHASELIEGLSNSCNFSAKITILKAKNSLGHNLME